jgi:hypothetical protein
MILMKGAKYTIFKLHRLAVKDHLLIPVETIAFSSRLPSHFQAKQTWLGNLTITVHYNWMVWNVPLERK